MTIRAKTFTPEVLLSAPRRSAGTPNADGSLVLYSISTYSFETHESQSEIRLLDVTSNQSKVLTKTKGASEATWLNDGNVLLLLPGEKGKTRVVIGNTDDWDSSSTEAGVIDGPAGDVKVVEISKDTYGFAFSAQVYKGELYNPEAAPKPHSTGRLYKSLMVRHWDSYVTPQKNAIWFSKLSKKGETQYKLSKPTNVLQKTDLESPIPPFGGSDHYDLSSSGIVFVAKDPSLNYATNTKQNVYFVPISDFESADIKNPQEIGTAGLAGQATSPVFSSDGRQIAFLKMKENGYEADKNQLLVVPDISRLFWVIHVFNTPENIGSWDKSPQSVAWSHDDKFLYLTAEVEGRSLLHVIPTNSLITAELPTPVQSVGSIAGANPLRNGKVFLSGSSLIDNSIYHLYDPQQSSGSSKVVSSNSHNGAMFGLSPGQVDSLWWPGATLGTKVHGWVIKPPAFNPKEKYPLAYLIHGGPQGAWLDSWSTRWNPAVFASQGYVVVCPNPTGSTGYGQKFVDDIQGQWGGLPYQDLANGFEYIEKNVPYIDTTRAIAAGASYGGYSINWMQGQPLGRKFKALVCHDGVFSMSGQMASEELWFPFHDLQGKLWENPDAWARWDPSRYTQYWATPQLVIHSELDYRLTIGEGLAAFNVLQAKGIESQFLTFPDENHWVLKPENSLVWHKVVFDWINQHVGLPKYSKDDDSDGLDEKTGNLVEETEKVRLE